MSGMPVDRAMPPPVAYTISAPAACTILADIPSYAPGTK